MCVCVDPNGHYESLMLMMILLLDFDYIDTYLQSHASFISSVDLLDQLAKRFNSTVQSCIQIK